MIFKEYMIIRMNKKEGFSMVEMIVYVALLAFFMIIAVNGAIIMMSSYSRAGSARLLDSSVELLVSKLGREVRNATSVNDSLSIFNQNPGKVSFYVPDGSGTTPVEFYVLDGVMKFKKSGVFIGDVTLQGVSVDSVIFKKISNNGKEAVRMVITMTARKGGQAKTETFYYTVALRGSY